MKKSILTLAAAIATTATVLSQSSPQAFNYQGIARDGVGNELPYQKISLKVSILEDSLTGNPVYVETHSDTTNEFGLFTFEIGKGVPFLGSFTSIVWGANSHYLKVEMDAAGGTSYLPMGTSQLLSVPYSLYSDRAGYADSAGAAPGSSAPILSLSGDTLSITGGSFVVITDNVDDADADPVNELQTLFVSGDTLVISNGNFVILPATAPSDTSLYSYSAGYADTADFSYSAGYADTADFSYSAGYADTADFAYNSGTATYADTAWFAFAAADADWTIDGDTLYSAADSTVTIKGGNVGIGTTFPTEKLDVSGNLRFFGALMPNNVAGASGQVLTSAGGGIPPTWTNLPAGITGSGTTNYIPKWAGVSSLSSTSNIYDDGTYVGIGTSTPGVRLHVKGTTTPGQQGYVRVEDIDPTGVAAFELRNNAGSSFFMYKNSSGYPSSGRYLPGASMIEGNNASGLSIGETTGDIRFYTGVNGTPERMTIKNAGNVGIGTTSPGQKLSISGNAEAGINYGGGFSAFNGGGVIVGDEGAITDANNSALNLFSRYGFNFYSNSDVDLTTADFVIKEDGNVGIGTTSPDARLDVTDTTAGVLIPRMTQAQRNINVFADEGEMIYQTDNNPGYYYWNGSVWVRLLNGGSPGSAWMLNGNTNTVDGTNFIGTTDAIPFNIRMNNQKAGRIENGSFFGNNFANTFFGYQAGNANATGGYNTALGISALFSDTTGEANTAIGISALSSNANGSYNTASGAWALYYNATGSNATAIGYNAMYYANNTTTPFTNFNVALGYEALRGSTIPSNNTGNYNTALGYQTLYSNTSGSYNTASGNYVLYSNISGSYNTASGYNALSSNTTGLNNTASGLQSLFFNTTGTSNTASGRDALYSNVAGNNATAIGYNAMYYANNTATPFTNYNVALGYEALLGSATASANTGNENTALGYQTLLNNTTGDENTASGRAVLYTNTSGSYNTASGRLALYLNTTGNYNTASGHYALYSNTIGNNNTAIGTRTLNFNSAGANNIGIGYYAGLGASSVDFNQCTFVGSNSYPTVARTNVTMLGANITNAQILANNEMAIGNTAITAIRGQVGFTTYSDARFKFNVQNDVRGLDFIMKLKPVTYNEDPTILHRIWGTPDSIVSNIDHSEIKKMRFIGFLAQDVEKAAKESGFNFPGIDVPGNEKEVYTLRYVDFIMPMVKSIQELNYELRITNDKLKAEIETLKFEVGKIKESLEMGAKK